MDAVKLIQKRREHSGGWKLHKRTACGAAHPLMAAHGETLAGNRLPIAYPLHQAVPDDGVLMLACSSPKIAQAVSGCGTSSQESASIYHTYGRYAHNVRDHNLQRRTLGGI